MNHSGVQPQPAAAMAGWAMIVAAMTSLIARHSTTAASPSGTAATISLTLARKMAKNPSRQELDEAGIHTSLRFSCPNITSSRPAFVIHHEINDRVHPPHHEPIALKV
jgi:hypothetical protein